MNIERYCSTYWIIKGCHFSSLEVHILGIMMQNVPQVGLEPATARTENCETDRTEGRGRFTDALRRRSNDRDSQLVYTCMLAFQLWSLISQTGLKMPIRDHMFIFVISNSSS